MASIDKENLEHLAKLARIDLDPKEEEKLTKDLGNMLAHFEELKKLDTSNIEPMAGGTDLKNVFREDGEPIGTNQGAGKDQFPETQKGFLKVPPVFE